MPYERKPGRPLSIEDVRRRIRDSDPSLPSHRLSSLGEGSQEIALSRGTNFRNLQRALREDLDWIVMKAIERERDRRYDSASELVADIQRHLNDEPVLAGPPKASYRIGKFVRRHRGGVGVALLLLTVLTGSAIVLAIQARTVAKQRDAIAAERDLAQREQARAEEITEFLIDIFGEATPQSSLGEPLTAQQILERGAARVEEDLADQPDLQVELMAVISRVYRQLALYDSAMEIGTRAVELADEKLEPDDHGNKLARLRLARLYYDLGEYERAEPILLDLRKQLVGVADDDDWFVYSASLNLASIYRKTDRLEECETLVNEQLAIIRAADEPDLEREISFLTNLSSLHVRRKEFEKGEAILQDLLEKKRALFGEESASYIGTLGNLGNVYWHQERWDKAEPIYRQVLEAKERIYGVGHPRSISSRSNLGRLLVRMRRMEEGTPVLRRSLKESRELYGETHPKVRALLWDLGLIAANMDRREEMMEMLTAHLEAGGLGRPLIEHPDFDPYRGQPDFERLVAIARARADERHTY